MFSWTKIEVIFLLVFLGQTVTICNSLQKIFLWLPVLQEFCPEILFCLYLLWNHQRIIIHYFVKLFLFNVHLLHVYTINLQDSINNDLYIISFGIYCPIKDTKESCWKWLMFRLFVILHCFLFVLNSYILSPFFLPYVWSCQKEKEFRYQ